MSIPSKAMPLRSPDNRSGELGNLGPLGELGLALAAQSKSLAACLKLAISSCLARI